MSKKIKIVIIVLAALLVVSLTALAGTLLYNALHARGSATSVVPDNLVTPGSKASSDSDEAASADTDGAPAETVPEVSPDADAAAAVIGEENVASAISRSPVYATNIYLHSRNTGDNEPFRVENMFPGDAETKYYCVRVSHEKDVTVHFHADIREGYEKLAEVLKCRVVLLTTGDVLYDGLMRDMPEAVDHLIAAGETTESELYYEIEAYLDTSVGNDYQAKELVADFRWWVEVDDVVPPTDTGEAPLWPYVAVASASLFLLILLTVKKKKEEAENA